MSDLYSLIRSSKSGDLRHIVSAAIDRFGAELVQTQVFVSQHGEASLGANLFADLAIASSDLPNDIDTVKLWQMCLYPATVTLFIGESGAGKSSIVYNMAVCAAQNESVFGVPFCVDRPLRILYVDPENAGQNCIKKLNRIGKGRPSGLIFHAGDNVDLSQPSQITALSQYITDQSIDVVILDPIANLFCTINENDNSEAARQMTALTRMSRRTGVCVIAVHHTGKEGTGNYGRGATARLASADVAMMLRCRGYGDDEVDDTFRGITSQREDIVRLQVTKNRIEGRGSLYLQMVGEDRFMQSSFAAWREAGNKKTDDSKIDQCRQDIFAYLSEGYWRPRAEIYSAMAQEDYGQVITDGALRSLADDGTVSSRRVGSVMTYILTAYLIGDSIVNEQPVEEITYQHQGYIG